MNYLVSIHVLPTRVDDIDRVGYRAALRKENSMSSGACVKLVLQTVRDYVTDLKRRRLTEEAETAQQILIRMEKEAVVTDPESGEISTALQVYVTGLLRARLIVDELQKTQQPSERIEEVISMINACAFRFNRAVITGVP